jgi:putative iron-regulated protein
MSSEVTRPPLGRARTLIVLALAGAAGCNDVSGPPPTAAPTSPVLEALATDVMLAKYADFSARADQLSAALAQLASTPDSAALASARAAWRDARVVWEASEAFAFGPAATDGLDAALDSWPLDAASLRVLLASDVPLDRPRLDNWEGSVKGFHGIEYVLFGTDGTKRAEQVTQRELAYLAAAGASLAGNASALLSAWSPAGGDYAGQIARAGQPSSVYPSEGAAVQELLLGMAGLLEEVAEEKIGEVLETGDRGLEESRFSDNSKADYAANVESVRLLYLGAGGNGPGLRDLVASLNPALDRDVRLELDQAAATLNAIHPTFGLAIRYSPERVEAAERAVARLEETLAERVLPVVTRR